VSAQKGGVTGQKGVIWPKYNNPKEFNLSNLTDMDTLQFPLFTNNLAALKISQFVLIHKVIFKKFSLNGEVSKAHKDAIKQHRGYSKRSL